MCCFPVVKHHLVLVVTWFNKHGDNYPQNLDLFQDEVLKRLLVFIVTDFILFHDMFYDLSN